MKAMNFLKVALLATPLLTGACKSKQKAAEEPAPVTAETVQQRQFLQKVNDNAQHAKFITSKVKFTVEAGPQKISLTGNLKMKRDDVIRMQLMAFGFVEAARLEFTQDYVLIMDRINKQFLKAPYAHIDFLRNSGLNFYSLQALFWNELFQPGMKKVSDESLKKYDAMLGGEDVVIRLEEGKMDYSWLASEKDGRIKMANILYKDRLNGNSQLNWDYTAFQKMGSKNFPTNMKITFTSPKKEVKLGLTLNYLGNESEWETRTEVSNKYREVSVDDILRRFMAM